jgi:hypothetical protein
LGHGEGGAEGRQMPAVHLGDNRGVEGVLVARVLPRLELRVAVRARQALPAVAEEGRRALVAAVRLGVGSVARLAAAARGGPLPAFVASQYFLTRTNRRYIGKSHSRPPRRTQRTPHLAVGHRAILAEREGAGPGSVHVAAQRRRDAPATTPRPACIPHAPSTQPPAVAPPSPNAILGGGEAR